MTKIQIYPDVGLSAVKDIENIGFNRISTLVYLNIAESLYGTHFNFCHVLKKEEYRRN
ncbi:hypothetical protein CJ739_2622 [Mariniflexile rhizosphaerae]|nr:hypothetical protein CJ739_2622 [Mariniflexile sp. TRM1-10]